METGVTLFLEEKYQTGWDPCSAASAPLSGLKWVKKKVSWGGVFDLAVEQPQLFRKLHKNKCHTTDCRCDDAHCLALFL